MNLRLLVLDCRLCTCHKALHDQLRQLFSFPEHYGRNLDALHDLLTEPMEPTTLQLLFPQALTQHLGPYGENLLALLDRCAQENPRLMILRQ